MKIGMAILAALLGGLSWAEDSAVFTPPKAYLVDRYEAGWNKNPFTLKTAPAAVEKVSFAKDFAIGAYYGDSENPTVIIVNTKTHDRFKLKNGEPAANGMLLKSVNFGSTRNKTTAQVRLGAETSELHFDDNYMKQVASAQPTRAPALQQQQQQRSMPVGGASVRVPLPTLPGQPVSVPQTNTLPANARAGISANPLGSAARPAYVPGNLPQPGTVNLTATPPANASGANLSVSTGVPPASNSPASLVSQAGAAASPTGSAPVPVRRRLVTPATNPAGIPQ